MFGQPEHQSYSESKWVTSTRGTSVDGIKLLLLLKCQSLSTTVLFRTTFSPGRSFPTYFQWNDSWVQTIHRTADDYLTVQNQVVAMGTSLGEVILNRSNLKKQQVNCNSIWQVWDNKVLATLESVKEKKKKYEAIIMGFTVRRILTTIEY